MRNSLVLLFACLIIGCSSSKRVPYEYRYNGKVYKGTLQRGRVIDTSYVYRADGSIEKIFLWTRKDGRTNQILISPLDTTYNAAEDSPRKIDGIEKVIYGSKQKWKSIYNRFLREKPGFRGKIEIRLIVGPQGNIEDIFILEDTLGYPEFSQEVVNVCASWIFEKTDDTGKEWITFPLTFYE